MKGLIPQSFIQDLLARVDIVEIAQSRIQLKKRGENYIALCPFHQEKTPSFTVSPKKQIYHCFGCGVGGDAIGFLMAFDHLDFIDAITTQAHQLGLSIPEHTKTRQTKQYDSLYTTLNEASRYYQNNLRHHEPSIDYLKSRSISGQTAKDFALGYAKDQWEDISVHLGRDAKTQSLLMANGLLIKKEGRHCYDRFRNRIMYPIRDTRGRVVAFGGRTLTDEQPKYLNSPETPIFHKGNELYGLYEMQQKHITLTQLLIVEGYMDVISLYEQGIYYAAATLGTATTVKHLQKLLRYSKKLVFCFDGDQAGQQAAWRALTVSLPLIREGVHIHFLFLPSNEDPDSLVKKIGKNDFEKLIEAAPPLAEVFFAKLKKDIPINSLAGKAAFASEAKRYIDTMPRGLYQQFIYEELARLLNRNISELAVLFTHQTNKRSTRQKEPQLAQTLANDEKPTPVLQACMLLLQHPHLAAVAMDYQSQLGTQTPERKLLNQLIQILSKTPELTIAQLIAHWEDPQQHQLLAALASRELPIPKSGVENEFTDALTCLITQNTNQLVTQLIEKARQNGLDSSERQKLQQLLQKGNDSPVTVTKA